MKACYHFSKSLLNFNFYRDPISFCCFFQSFRRMESTDLKKATTEPYQNGVSEPTNETISFQNEKSNVVLRPIAICGPSGCGKSTLLRRILEEFKGYISFSISHTTRKPRPSEKNGKDYHFVSRAEMEKAIASGEFLEHAEYSGNLYGTSRSSVVKIQKNGQLCIMDVDMMGVKNLRKTSLNPKFVFVKTPSLEVLEERLRNRHTESEDVIKTRLARAKEELAYSEIEGNFDFILVNDDLEKAYQQLKAYLLPDIMAVKKCMEVKSQRIH